MNFLPACVSQPKTILIPNRLASDSFERIRTALLPNAEGIKKFVLERTRLNGRPFSLKNHEYQGKILDIVSNPDLDLVVMKPSQLGISEVVYRIVLANMSRIPGFASAIIFPTVKMANEVMQTRISQTIHESEVLRQLISKSIDSAAVKMFNNGSIIYALGASATSSTSNINRPIRCLIVDEFARADLDMVTSLRSRQRHQEHKSSIYFSTPLLQEADIDAEMNKCGVIWEQLLSCEHCRHQFFPDFWENVILPGYTGDLKDLKQETVDSHGLNLNAAYLCCPSCGKATRYEYNQVTWVDTAEFKTRPKTGIKLSAFSMPAYVKVPDMVRDLLAYSDRAEFTQQVLGKPAEFADTTIDISAIEFITDEPGPVNVMGIDVGNICTVTVGCILNDFVYSHVNIQVPIMKLEEEVKYLHSKYRVIATVIDYLPNTVLSVRICNTFPNAWVARYIESVNPEMLKTKESEHEGLGKYRAVEINKNPFFDHFATEIMSGKIKMRASEDSLVVKKSMQVMQRIRDRSKQNQGIQYVWVKPRSNAQDHFHHSNVYMLAAANLIHESCKSTVSLDVMVKGFKLKNDI